REWSTTSVTRREVSSCVAEALGLVPAQVRDGWHAGHEDETVATLSVPVNLGADSSATLELELFTHLETAYDLLTLEATADGAAPGSRWPGSSPRPTGSRSRSPRGRSP